MSLSTLDLFAITAPGVEPYTHTELSALGIAPSAAERGGVAWTGSLDDVYAANLWLRTTSRVVARVGSFRATTFFELERKSKRLSWERYLTPRRAVRFRVTCRKSRLYHSDAVAQRLRDAVLRVTGEGATVDTARGRDDDDAGEAQLFIVRVDHDIVTVSADTSGALLHRRGYRLATAKAPLRETLAAAMLLASGWDPRAPLIDPMCGSGTIAIEAALLARKIAPGMHRGFAFRAWPDFHQQRWVSHQERAREGELAHAPGVIRASDRDAGAVQAAHANAERAGVRGDIDISQRAISAVEPMTAPEGGPGWIVTNPPYGMRVGDHSVRNLYAQLGKVVRTNFPEWHLTLLSADPSLERQVGIPLGRLFDTSNGGIPVRCVLGSSATGGIVPAR